jgi:putative ABC transport system ATP-binding protein
LAQTLSGNNTTSPNSVEVVDLRKTYVTGKLEYQALRGVSLTVRKGEFVAIVGPSGSGKTTLMNIVGTLDRPTEGEVFIDGTPVSKMNDDEYAYLRNRKLGFVFQAFNLVSYLTAVENVELPLVAAGVAPQPRRAKANELLQYLGLGDKGNKKPNELSGGEQQRVAVARALVNDPSLILADEPTGNLDSKSAEAVVGLLRGVSEEKGVTVMMITHNLDLTKSCHRVFRIRDGLIEEVEVRN